MILKYNFFQLFTAKVGQKLLQKTTQKYEHFWALCTFSVQIENFFKLAPCPQNRSDCTVLLERWLLPSKPRKKWTCASLKPAHDPYLSHCD